MGYSYIFTVSSGDHQIQPELGTGDSPHHSANRYPRMDMCKQQKW